MCVNKVSSLSVHRRRRDVARASHLACSNSTVSLSNLYILYYRETGRESNFKKVFRKCVKQVLQSLQYCGETGKRLVKERL